MNKLFIIVASLFLVFNIQSLELNFNNKFEEILYEGKKKKIVENLNNKKIPPHFHKFILKDADFNFYFLKNYNNKEKIEAISRDVWINTLCSIINIGDSSLELLDFGSEIITENRQTEIEKLNKVYKILEGIEVIPPSEEEVKNNCLIFNEADLEFLNISIEDLK